MQTKLINQENGTNWTLYNGDSCEVLTELPNNSVGFSVYSPPFSSLYVYSNSDRDLGNCKTDEEFFEHYEFIVREIYRALQPGRLCSVHCMNLPCTITHNGYIGIRDFRGDIIRLHQKIGFIYHSEVCIWKDPVTAMQRTKAIGLLHKQIVKDSSISRQGIPDYVCTFRKPGKNENPIKGEFDHFAGDQSTFKHEGNLSIDIWQRYASPVWMDINPSNTLQFRTARDNEDERHICPLQLDVIERCLQLWSMPDDIVLSPFAGIGSECYQAVKMGRKAVGCELKESYFKAAVKNLRVAEKEWANSNRTLFSE
jgi:hypothetical protein